MFLANALSSKYAPIQSAMLAHLDAGEIIALSRTCRSLSSLWQTFIATKFSIDHLLQKFFRRPQAFRSVQASCEALIIDDSARHFFARRERPLLLLEITVRPNRLPTLQAYLNSEGYDQCGNEGVSFSKECDDGRRRNIVVLAHPSPTGSLSYCLCQTSTTASRMFISWNKAYCLFPAETFLAHEAYLTDDLDEYVAFDLAELTEEGLATKNLAWSL